MRRWKSDPLVILGARESRVHGEAAGQVELLIQGNIPCTVRGRRRMSTQLDQIAKKAKSNPKVRFTSLAHLLTPEFLKETWQQMNRRGASGIDGETTTEFEQDLDTRVQELGEGLKRGTYKAPPVRRVEISKGPGRVGTRPLGIPTVEDRLLQRAVARILEAVFGADFLECSYGYRPGRNPHDALRVLRGIIVTKKVGHLFEADIRGYFNHIQHEMLQKMVAHRIADPLILRLIGKWLNAGYMLDGMVVRTKEGSPQGGPITPRTQSITSNLSGSLNSSVESRTTDVTTPDLDLCHFRLYFYVKCRVPAALNGHNASTVLESCCSVIHRFQKPYEGSRKHVPS